MHNYENKSSSYKLALPDNFLKGSIFSSGKHMVLQQQGAEKS